MDSQFLQIQTLLEQRAEITARLNLIPYDGSCHELISVPKNS